MGLKQNSKKMEFKISQLNEINNGLHLLRNNDEFKRKLGDSVYEFIYIAKQNTDELERALETPHAEIAKLAESLAGKDKDGKPEYTTTRLPNGQTYREPKVLEQNYDAAHTGIEKINNRKININLQKFELAHVKLMLLYLTSLQQDLFLNNLVNELVPAKKQVEQPEHTTAN